MDRVFLSVGLVNSSAIASGQPGAITSRTWDQPEMAISNFGLDHQQLAVNLLVSSAAVKRVGDGD
jgi:hypothetical protein